jgi:hypothetical protein
MEQSLPPEPNIRLAIFLLFMEPTGLPQFYCAVSEKSLSSRDY